MENTPFLKTTLRVDFVKDVIIQKIVEMEDDLKKMVERELTPQNLAEKIQIHINREINFAISHALDEIILKKVNASRELNEMIEGLVDDVVKNRIKPFKEETKKPKKK